MTLSVSRTYGEAVARMLPSEVEMLGILTRLSIFCQAWICCKSLWIPRNWLLPAIFSAFLRVTFHDSYRRSCLHMFCCWISPQLLITGNRHWRHSYCQHYEILRKLRTAQLWVPKGSEQFYYDSQGRQKKIGKCSRYFTNSTVSTTPTNPTDKPGWQRWQFFL